MKQKQSKSFANASRCEFLPLETRQMQAVDLAITSVSVGTRITSAGQGFDITYTVKNNGTTATTGTTFIRNYLSEDKKLGNADDIGLDTGFYKPSIPAGGT